MAGQITVVSGKGGTGKTSLTALWASYADKAVFVDADVDASNLPLAIPHTIRERHRYIGREVAVVERSLCTNCGLCAELCRFDAFVTTGEGEAATYDVDPLACEGCGLCKLACPSQAISMIPHESGEWFVSDTEFGPLAHARLSAAEGNSGKLVTQVRRRGEDLAEEEERELIVIDGPPGIGCQTTAALTGVGLAVVVAEPTMSGRHDVGRVLQVIERLGIAAAVILNKVDLAPAQEGAVRLMAAQHGAEFIGTVPFVPALPRSLASGTLLSAPPPELVPAVRSLWTKIMDRVTD